MSLPPQQAPTPPHSDASPLEVQVERAHQAPVAADAAQAGRGGLALAAGKIYFMVAGLIQQILISRLLGLGAYGAFSTAQSAASISYNPLVQAGIQGVSREVASSTREEAALVQRRLLFFHLVIASIAALLFFALARPLALWLGAPHVAGGLRFFSAVLFLYALYAPLIGALNGTRRFLGQAGLDALAATLRTVGLLAGAYVATKWFRGTTAIETTSLQVEGTVLGFCAAAVLILTVALKMAGWGKAGGQHPRAATYVAFIIPILGGQILLNLLFQADALLLRKFASEAAVLAHLAPAAADPYVGAYRATQLFCFLPFQLLTSVTFVLFPLLASAQAKGDTGSVALLVGRGLRISLIVAGLIISTLMAVPGGLISLVFGPEASALGAESMRVLAVGMGFFALLGVMTTAMNSLGAQKQSFVLIAIAVVAVTLLCLFGAKTDVLNASLLVRVAAATSTAMVLTTVIAAFQLRKLAGASLLPLSVVRTVFAVTVAGFLGAKWFTGGPIKTLLGATSAGVLFVLVLAATRELKKADWDLVRTLGRRS